MHVALQGARQQEGSSCSQACAKGKNIWPRVLILNLFCRKQLNVMNHKPSWALISRPRPTISVKLKSAILSHTDQFVKDHAAKMHKLPNTCWHCTKPLTINTVHIDHHPQPFRFISTLWCDPMTWLPHACRCRPAMTNDPIFTGNLVPSCKSCNLSHRFEHSYDNCTFRWCSLAFKLRLCILLALCVVFTLGFFVAK